MISISLLAGIVTAGTIGVGWPSSAGPGASAATETAPPIRIAMNEKGTRPARVIKLADGQVTIDMDAGDERVRITDSKGQVGSESHCPAQYGTYDQFHSFFKDFKAALIAGNSQRVVELVRYPLQVNSTPAKQIKNKAELARQYGQVFSNSVLKDIQAAEPAAIFCSDGRAMLGNGLVWVRGDKGRVAVDVVNP